MFRTIQQRRLHPHLWIAAFFCGLLLVWGLSPVRAATNRYVNPSGNCSGNNPCYNSLAGAINATQNNDTIILLADVNGATYSSGASGVTIKGVNANIQINGGMVINAVNNWTIQDLKASDAILVKDVTGSLTIQNTRPVAIFVQPTTDLNATLNINNNTLTDPNNSEISVIGALGKKLNGNYTFFGNQNLAYLNILTYVNSTGSADLGANITIQQNTLKNGISLGVGQKINGVNGVGNISGTILIDSNTVTAPTLGIDVAIGSRPAGFSAGASGTIRGNVTITNNNADRIALITIEALGTNNPMTSNTVVTGNTGELIEIGFNGDYTGALIDVRNNQLDYAGSESVITVRANSFTNATTIKVEDNSGRIGIVFDTFVGVNAANVSVQRNGTCIFIGYRAKTNHSGTLTIADNYVDATGYPVQYSDAGYITLKAESGTFGNATILRNTALLFSTIAGTNVTGTLDIQGNRFLTSLIVNSLGSTGPGVVNAKYNRIGTNPTDSSTILNTNALINFNAMLGRLGGAPVTWDATNNWWGCNGGPGASGCGTSANSVPYLVFNTTLVCTGLNTKLIAGFDVTRNSAGQSFKNISVPGTVNVSTSSGTVLGGPAKPLKPGFSWNSAVISVPTSPVNITTTLDRQNLFYNNKSCPVRTDTPGIFRNGQWLLSTSNSTVGATLNFYFGAASWLPVVGDWNADGIDTVGGYDSSTGIFYIRNSNTTGGAEASFYLGNPGDTPMAGRFDPTMANDGAGVFRPSNGIIYLKRSLSTGFADYFMILGNPGDKGFTGDWDGDGYDGPGVFRPSLGRFYISNNSTAAGVIYGDGFADYGPANDPATFPVIGDWNADSFSGIGVFRNGVWNLRNANTGPGAANYSFNYGDAGDKPVAGHWLVTPYDLNGPSVPNILVSGSVNVTAPTTNTTDWESQFD